jgi:hypothetical protein
MKNPNGKIGRLPGNLQHEINLRLLNGSEGPELLAWLNSLPAVRDVLDRKFGGREINHQNLTAWRSGGYREWKFKRDLFMAALDHQAAAAKGMSAQTIPPSLPPELLDPKNSVWGDNLLGEGMP